MVRYNLVSISSGILFGVMDGIINANPLAQKLYRAFEPIAKKTINIPACITIDIVYGFIMAGIFLMINKSLPGESGIIRGVVFGIIVWFSCYHAGGIPLGDVQYPCKNPALYAHLRFV